MGLLRFFLALSVVIFHTGDFFGIKFVGGQVAVQGFYLISGFYMAMILNEKYPSGLKGYYLFLSNRFLKIFPIYWAVAIVTLLFCVGLMFAFPHAPNHLYLYSEYGAALSAKSWLTIVFTNIALFGQDILFFTNLNTSTGNLFFSDQLWQTTPHVFDFMMVPQAWSVSCELMFYIIAPFTVRKPVFSFLILGASFVLRYLFISKGLSADPWSYRFLPFELQFFFMGAIAYFLLNKVRNTSWFQNKTIGTLLMSAIILFTIFYGNMPDTLYVLPSKFLMFNNGFFIFTFKFWIYISLLFVATPFIFYTTKSNKWDRFIGEFSYPIYIAHMLVIFIYEAFQWNDQTSTVRTIVVCLTTILIAHFLNRKILAPIELIRQKRVK